MADRVYKVQRSPGDFNQNSVRDFLKTDPFRDFVFDEKNGKKCFDAKKRPHNVVLRPYFLISFCTDFESLSNGIK